MIDSASKSPVRSTIAISFDGLFKRNLSSCCCFGAAHSGLGLTALNDNGEETETGFVPEDDGEG